MKCALKREMKRDLKCGKGLRTAAASLLVIDSRSFEAGRLKRPVDRHEGGRPSRKAPATALAKR